ncbi:MAG TPA: sigma-70 family RNA polymerase sigma factor [Thermoflexia bacterium]|nr:sigma-70 family RNA polymerase sigma factor [Thermoflexia bacterium]
MAIRHADGWLIARLQEGDIEALGELYERYKIQVYRTALAITHDEQMAEDILQETFLRIYAYADRIDETLPLGPWLYRVTVNLAYSWIRRARLWLGSIEGLLEHLLVPTCEQPECWVEEAERQHILQRAIEALPLNQRVVVVLYYLEGLSLKEIAYVIDVPEGTVKSRLHYARESLRKAVLERERRLVPEVAYDFT